MVSTIKLHDTLNITSIESYIISDAILMPDTIMFKSITFSSNTIIDASGHCFVLKKKREIDGDTNVPDKMGESDGG